MSNTTSFVPFKNVRQKQFSSSGELPTPPPQILRRQIPWKCAECGTRKTPVKRSGSLGPATLCNACGIRFRKRNKAKSNSLAAPTATAANILSQERLPQDKKFRLMKKPQPCESRQPPLKQHCMTDHWNNIQTKAVFLPSVSLPSPVPSSLVAIPSHRPCATNPVFPGIATGIVATPAQAIQPPNVSQVPLVVSTNGLQFSDPIAATPMLQVPASNSAASSSCATLVGSQSIPTTATKPLSPSRSTFLLFPPQPLPTLEGVRPLPTETAASGMVNQLPYCGKTKPSSGEDMIHGETAELGFLMDRATRDVGFAESTDETKPDNLACDVFEKCRSNDTAPGQVELLDLFRETDTEELEGTLLENKTQSEVPNSSSGALKVGQSGIQKATARPLPLGESAVVMGASAHDGNTMKVRGFVAKTGVDGQADLTGRYVNQLQFLERISAETRDNIDSIEDKIAVQAKHREELKVAQNKISLSIWQLSVTREIARQKQLEVNKCISQTSYLLRVLCRQSEYV